MTVAKLAGDVTCYVTALPVAGEEVAAVVTCCSAALPVTVDEAAAVEC